MRKDIALAGKIDAEHRSRQNLSDGALRDDLFFLCHCAPNIPWTTRGSTMTLSQSGVYRDLAELFE
jgi:hypothetical protein